MKNFVKLYESLDQTTKTNEKVAALAKYFDHAEDKDKLWTIALLSHKRPKRTVSVSLLREWAKDLSGLPLWLFNESYSIVGDFAETIAILLPDPRYESDHSLSFWIENLKKLQGTSESEKKSFILKAWDMLNRNERFVFNKLLTGGWRIGLSKKLMIKALAIHSGVEGNILSHRLLGKWEVETTDFKTLITDDGTGDISRPYPFYLAYSLDKEIKDLGDPSIWCAERKWDGIRGQIIKRRGEIFVWTRGEELVTDRYPEYQILRNELADGTVIDGEIMPFKDKPLPFQLLQKRIGRKSVSKKILLEVPVVFIAYDLLENNELDARHLPYQERRLLLQDIVKDINRPTLLLSEEVEFDSWEKLEQERNRSRELDCEGIMLKLKDSTYKVGRKKGEWWKWKIDPYTVDAVMIYAMRGHGRRANLYSDYTFAVWDGNDLVPFTKAYSGLTDKEIVEVDKWVRKNTLDRFGPVRAVKPELVFEIAFEGINKSSRHKSGIALRFPRIHRWRKDKSFKDADKLEFLLELLG
ncbi:MAG: ATP-dependent DNA ligase [Bacteroidia bacterium]|nr:ATP-dependent DNA ligase [Bacteroidia bacterium]